MEDFQECLKLQQKHLDSNNRLLAETHYQLGLTYSMNLEYSKAIEELNNSISVIKSRLGKQRWLLHGVNLDGLCIYLSSIRVLFLFFYWSHFQPHFQSSNRCYDQCESLSRHSNTSTYLSDKLQELLDKAEGPDALPDERKEMEELKALLPEIQEKVEDANEGLKTASTAAEAVKGVLVSWGMGLLCLN